MDLKIANLIIIRKYENSIQKEKFIENFKNFVFKYIKNK